MKFSIVARVTLSKGGQSYSWNVVERTLDPLFERMLWRLLNKSCWTTPMIRFDCTMLWLRWTFRGGDILGHVRDHCNGSYTTQDLWEILFRGWEVGRMVKDEEKRSRWKIGKMEDLWRFLIRSIFIGKVWYKIVVREVESNFWLRNN